ncbi:MAG: helix-turn-helix transcriptional regulator [Candidatus Heimdallarchaeota archaeon]
MSSIQVAILMEFAKAGDKPKKITEIITALTNSFQGIWEPKKGTIYPATHNLSVRGFLKIHAVKPYGFTITENGHKAIKEIFTHINLQMEAYMVYYTFLLGSLSEIDKKKAEETTRMIVNIINEKIKDFEK